MHACSFESFGRDIISRSSRALPNGVLWSAPEQEPVESESDRLIHVAPLRTPKKVIILPAPNPIVALTYYLESQGSLIFFFFEWFQKVRISRTSAPDPLSLPTRDGH